MREQNAILLLIYYWNVIVNRAWLTFWYLLWCCWSTFCRNYWLVVISYGLSWWDCIFHPHVLQNWIIGHVLNFFWPEFEMFAWSVVLECDMTWSLSSLFSRRYQSRTCGPTRRIEKESYLASVVIHAAPLVVVVLCVFPPLVKNWCRRNLKATCIWLSRGLGFNNSHQDGEYVDSIWNALNEVKGKNLLAGIKKRVAGIYW